MKKLSLIAVALITCYSLVFAQEKGNRLPYTKWEIGLNAGVANYTGGYNMYKDDRFGHFNEWDNDMNFGFGAFVKKNFTHVFALEAAWNYTNLTGQWSANKMAVPSYKTEVNEYDLNSVWNINNLFSSNKFDRKVYWYAKLGVGATHVYKKEGLDPLNGENWKTLTIPVGIKVESTSRYFSAAIIS